LFERHREGLQWPVDHCGHQRGNRTAVQSTRQKHAERHVGHQANADRFFEQFPEPSHNVRVAETRELRRRLARRDVPVLPNRDRAAFKDQGVPRLKPVDTLEQRLGA
jgi:hypothetical protein